jgi:hypothetical protein
MERDLQHFVAACPNCQIQQRPRKAQEKEFARLTADKYVQPFQRWGIDLIGILPNCKTKSENRRIITIVDYITGWPIAKAVPDATEEAVTEFIFSEIYMY